MRVTRSAIGPVLLAVGLSSGAAFAGEWHSADTEICSDCHTIHNSAGRQPMRYDRVAVPAPGLLRAADPTHLCLACHDGSRPDAADVVAPVSYLANPAGGWFRQDPVGQANPNGHDLGQPSPVTPPGSTDPMTISCVSCHDPHGGPNYRNLLPVPVGPSNAQPVTVVVSQKVLIPAAAPSEVYAPANLLYKSGMSAWCSSCHPNFHGKNGGGEGLTEPWLRHPQDSRISGAYGLDYAHWSATIPDRVPVQTPQDDVIPSADDEVFCLSCHKAHGSDRKAGLIFADGATMLSTCQQCHNE